MSIAIAIARAKDVGRLMQFVDKKSEPGHWVWTGGRNYKGYGSAWLWGKHDTAHRQFYRLFKGPVPDSKFVLHSCDRPYCVNPNCLSLGTPKKNSEEMVERGRSSVGARQGNAVLTAEKIYEMAELRRAGQSIKWIAEKYGILAANLSRIFSGARWAHLNLGNPRPGVVGPKWLGKSCVECGVEFNKDHLNKICYGRCSRCNQRLYLRERRASGFKRKRI